LRDARTRQLVGIGGAVELRVALADADGFIGTEVLRRFAVTLDYARGRAVFEPNIALRAPFCRNAAGLCVRTGSAVRGAEVFWVDAGSSGARAGIRPGNLILAIDGTSVINLSTTDVDRLLDRGPGPMLEIARSAAQFRALSRDAATQRGPISRRAPVRERVGELVRLPNP
jgi:predicted metalloprotease with PDZ domain